MHGLMLAILIVIGGSPLAHAAVWSSKSVWNEAAERKYSHWIQRDFSETFFTHGPWTGIKTDCADAVYGARIIFSYLNGLPFSLGPSHPEFSSETQDFDNIEDPVLRVRAFINSVNNRTWTGTLSEHTYPIAISRKSVVPGTIWLKSGHAEVVRSVRENGVVELRGSWLPAAIRNMITISSLGSIPKNPKHGFRRWIWPQQYESPREALLGFDESQFSEAHLDIASFEESVHRRLARSGKIESRRARTQRLARDFCSLLGARAEVVELGHQYFESTGRCLNRKEYHAFSTPSRDSNLRRVAFALGNEMHNDLGAVSEALDRCPALTLDGSRNLTAFDFLVNLLKLDFSSDPHESVGARFGLSPEEKACVEIDSGGDEG